ncbi:iron ABC transporter ATP-binding protein [Streptococcus sp. DD13]|uniref:iron ABC transporter ATP-binding protein n=1 Tax=Streptococcus sp. DD13 TaxID=1777881 RepID=UPI000831513E|nr:ATP-binding cassette domain-containing protein [Streptococcus sp. DD13]
MQMEKLSKRYGGQMVLEDIGLKIDEGKLTAFIGPNGAGKSTLLSIISRLLPKEEGILYIRGIELESWNSVELAKELSMLKQKIDYQVKMTVEELVSFGRYPYSKGRLTREDQIQIDQAIAYMDLDPYRKRPIDQLSGGQLQRVNIAMILSQDTDIVLLDEPLNNLDLKQGSLMMKTLRRLVEELGKTVVVVIHDINVASQFADQIVAFKDGKVFCSGKPEQVMTQEVLEDLFEMKLTIAEVNGKKICLYE